MQFSQLTAILGLMASSAIAHSWLECVDTKVVGEGSPEIEGKDEAYFKANPTKMNDWNEKCYGYPRNPLPRARSQSPVPYMAPQNWIDESSNYMYQFDEYEDGKVLACKACQRTPTQTELPRAKATPGQKLLMRYWGNGHSTSDGRYANPRNRHPGVVRIYWSGEAGKELKYLEDMNESNWIKGAQQGFGDNAVIDFTNTPTKNQKGEDQLVMKEWADYFEFTVPHDAPNGVYPMYWVWAWDLSNSCPSSGPRDVDANTYASDFKASFGTCFDIEVVDSTATGTGIVASQAEQKAETASKPSPEAEGCTTPCFVGGMTDLCDPSTGASCPPCRIRAPGKDHSDCYAECNEWLKGDMCPTGGSKLKRHQHRRHRRSMM